MSCKYTASGEYQCKYTASGEYQCNYPSGKTIEHFRYMDNASLEACTRLFYEKTTQLI